MLILFIMNGKIKLKLAIEESLSINYNVKHSTNKSLSDKKFYFCLFSSLKQVYVAIISACITFPINVILIGLFRSIRPPNSQQKPDDAVNSTSNPAFEDDNDVNEAIEQSPIRRMDGSSPSGDMLIENTGDITSIFVN